MKRLATISGFALFSLAAATSADAACRQVYGGTSCNWMGQCWHNPPKTVCDAPPPRIASPPPMAQRPQMAQPSNRLVGNDGASLIGNDSAGLRNNRLIGNDAGSFRR
jgi:hypothetical protein